MKIIDISVGLEKGMPVWPDSRGINLTQSSSIDGGDDANVTCISADLHVGTHIENSLHFIKGGDNVSDIDFSLLMGEARVVDFLGKSIITAVDLKESGLDKNTTRVLFKTDNSVLWNQKNKSFKKDYVGLDASAASWIAESNIKLVGIDYLSIANFDQAKEVHRILLGGRVIVLETLNLSDADAGTYKLICLPLKISRSEAAPARAILINL